MHGWSTKLTAASCVMVLVGLGATDAESQTYRKTWTTTADFEANAPADTVTQVNVTARGPLDEAIDQLRLDLGQIETPYIWVSNSNSNTVARIDTDTGRVLSLTEIPRDGGDQGPSRTAVDLDFNCWVSLRSTSSKLTHKLSALDGSLLSPFGVQGPIGNKKTRGIAINASGEVWVSASGPETCQNPPCAYGWNKINPEPPFRPSSVLQSFSNPMPSYGIAIDPSGKIFSTSAWLPDPEESLRVVQRIDGDTGAIEQTWTIDYTGDDNRKHIYGLITDVNGGVWGTFWPGQEVIRIDGGYQCPGGQAACSISPGNGLTEINVLPALQELDPTLDSTIGGRGIAVDGNGFVWAVFNRQASPWEGTSSYVVKIDSTTNEPVLVTEVGSGAVGITPDANGFIWVVNHDGGGENFEESYTCPQPIRQGEPPGEAPNPSVGGTIMKLRSSDGSVVATYPTCGVEPYTYSDMAGYSLRSVALRSGNWRVTHDSGRANLEWERINWASQEFDDTTLRLRVRAANSLDTIGAQPFVAVENNADMPVQGQYIEVEAFFFTRNDFLGPALDDLTVSSVCIPGQTEVCDGIDNDCDGMIDNGDLGGEACDTGLQGICSQGTTVCRQGRFECQATTESQPETCNEEDDNCNGVVDEGVTNLCGTCGDIPVEVCDGDDNDCDTLVDEGTLNACGTCGVVPMEVCNAQDDDCDGLFDEGVLNACDNCGPTPDEICNEEDDDCDGLVDEGVVNACGTCGPAPVEACDGEDNDCDGLVDEDLRNACGDCGPEPAEICDREDNDCDGDVDEGLVNACGFCGESPVEVCDGVDNDCDEEVDEGLLNACNSCGDLPAESCNGVDDNCNGEIDEGVLNTCGGCGLLPEELCDGQDNDCDELVDEGVMNACGTCGALGADLCDGIDNNCDGQIDEDSECTGDQACVRGQCVEECAQSECPRGFVCIDDYCLVDECIGLRCPEGQGCWLGECLTPEQWPCRDITCEDEAQVCIAGECVNDPCPDISCEAGEQCYLGECRPEEEVACLTVVCEDGEVCDAGDCVPDPCTGVTCEAGERCVEGTCEDACNSVECDNGFLCDAGECIADPCNNINCGEGQVCSEGNCVWEACDGVTCAPEEQCGENGCEPIGTCGEAVCTEGETCVNGVCIDPNNIEVPGTGNGTGDGPTTPGGDGGGTDDGCGCASVATPAPRAPWELLLAVAGIVGVVLRRRL